MLGQNQLLCDFLRAWTELTALRVADSLMGMIRELTLRKRKETVRDAADHRRAFARDAVGADRASQEQLSEMCARRRPSGPRADDQLWARTDATDQRSARVSGRGSPLAGSEYLYADLGNRTLTSIPSGRAANYYNPDGEFPKQVQHVLCRP